MIVYMIRHRKNGTYYRRGHYKHWAPQEKASIWPSKQGPAAAMSHGYVGNNANVIPFKLVSIEENNEQSDSN